MQTHAVLTSPVRFSGTDLSGEGVVVSRKTLGELSGVFADEAARVKMPQMALAYEVIAHFPVADATPGGLFFGISYIQTGNVGGECFMTRGHFHKLIDRGEYYWGLAGDGLLLLMTPDRKARLEKVQPGSLHYIPGHTAHRLINTGDTQLAVGACWPSDAGHDYASIERDGFSIRVYRHADGSIELREVK